MGLLREVVQQGPLDNGSAGGLSLLDGSVRFSSSSTSSKTFLVPDDGKRGARISSV
jgi:hypothetical protein